MQAPRWHSGTKLSHNRGNRDDWLSDTVRGLMTGRFVVVVVVMVMVIDDDVVVVVAIVIDGDVVWW